MIFAMQDTMEWFLANQWFIYYGLWAAGIAGIIIYVLTANRGKIKVRIRSKAGLPERIRFIKPTTQDSKTYLILSKGSKGKAGTKIELQPESIYRSGFYGRKVDTVDYFQGSLKTAKPDFQEDTSTAPSITRQDVEDYAKPKLWHKRYANPKGEGTPMAIWIVGIISVASVALIGYFIFIQFPGAVQAIKDQVNQTRTVLAWLI